MRHIDISIIIEEMGAFKFSEINEKYSVRQKSSYDIEHAMKFAISTIHSNYSERE